MANEVAFQHTVTGDDLYAIIYNPDLLTQVRDVVSNNWDTVTDGDWGDYDIVLTEQGTASKWYVGSLPSGLDLSNNYPITIFKRLGGSPVVTDLVVGHGNLGLEQSNLIEINSSATLLAKFARSLSTVIIGTVQSGSTDTVVQTDLTETENDQYKDRLLGVADQTLVGQMKEISGYNGSTKAITVSQLTQAPSSGDLFAIV